MSDTAELHGKILTFLSGEFARKEGRQCVSIDLLYAPGGGFKEEDIRKWVRADEPDTFENLAELDKLISQIIEIAESEADAKPAGKHRFVLRTHQGLGGRATQSFFLYPKYNGSGDDTAIVAPGGGGGAGGGRPDIIANHAALLMRTNREMFDGTIRVLGQQSSNLYQQVVTLTTENAKLRTELEEARSNKLDREFQMAMAHEKNLRTNQGFQHLLQLGTVVAAKIAGGDEAQGGQVSPLAMLIRKFGESLRKDQIGAVMGILDMSQKMMFVEIMNMVTPSEPEEQPSTLPAAGA